MQTLLSAPELCRVINRNGGAILDNAPSETVDAYLSIQEKLQNTDVSTDLGFQTQFLEHHKVRGVRIKNATLARYFEIMQEEKGSLSMNLRRLSIELFGKNVAGNVRTNHISFVSQMMNMLNDAYPVFDVNSAYIFGFEGPTQSRMTLNERIQIYDEFYNYMRSVYQEILESKMLYDLLKVYEMQLKLKGYKVTIAKRLDLVVRATGALDKKGLLILPEYRSNYSMA